MISRQLLLSLSETEVEDVLRCIDEYEHANSLLDSEIESHMRTIRQLRHEREKNDIIIRRYKGMIGLATRLPLEILAYIFEICVFEGWTRTPLVVSHVCSAWRKAALAPTVWTNLYVNLESREPYQRTQLWLERSKTTLLDVTLELANDRSSLHSVIELLVAHSHRWKTLTIQSFYFLPVNDILRDIGSENMENLSRVSISIVQEFSDPQGFDVEDIQPTALPSAFQNAPGLKTLFISRNILPTTGLIPGSIQDLTLQLKALGGASQQPLTAILQLLQGLLQLIRLSIEVPIGQEQVFILDVVGPQSHELPNLESFTLAGSNEIFGLLDYIRTPSLRHLHLRSYLEELQPEQNAARIRGFLANSSAPITLLEIRDMTLPSEFYDTMFQHLQSLEELRLHDSDILDTTLDQLHGDEFLCPYLKVMDLRWCGRLTGSGLAEVVQGRLLVGTRIESVTVLNCAHVKEEDILDIAGLTVCRLRHNGSTDMCAPTGCCDNERYRKRFYQRNYCHPAITERNPHARIVL